MNDPRSRTEQFDENNIEHNDAPPLAVSDWQRFDDPTGAFANMLEEEDSDARQNA